MPLIVPGVTPIPRNVSKGSQVSAAFVPALIVVDMQTDFVSGSLAVPDAKSIVDPINAFMKLPFSVKYGTKDFHPPDHISFASNHGKSVGDTVLIYPPGQDPQVNTEHGIEQFLWPDHCVQSTPGAEFVDGFESSLLHGVVHKGTDRGVECYSGFCDPWGSTDTGLHTLLSQKGVTDVFVVGLAGDYCVKNTAIDAASEKYGYKTWVVKDLTRSVGDNGKEWDELQLRGVTTLESWEVKELLEDKVLK